MNFCAGHYYWVWFSPSLPPLSYNSAEGFHISEPGLLEFTAFIIALSHMEVELYSKLNIYEWKADYIFVLLILPVTLTLNSIFFWWLVLICFFILPLPILGYLPSNVFPLIGNVAITLEYVGFFSFLFPTPCTPTPLTHTLPTSPCLLPRLISLRAMLILIYAFD